MAKREYPADLLMRMYEEMTRVRRFESKIADFCFPRGILSGNFHTCIGQEATVVGACYALAKGDYIMSTHRGHGHCIAKGAKTDRMMAELFGKATGYCKGRGGSLHVADVGLGILGANGIVGGGIAVATGSALATQIRGGGEVTLVFFGDGASNEGTFHEAINMAATMKLPIIYLCENNQFGVTTPIGKVINTDTISVRATAYGIPGATVDGNDVLAVYEAVQDAAEHARAGKGPSLVESKTFRIRPHHSADKELRAPELVDEWKKRDPILLLKERLLTRGVEEGRLLAIDKAVEAEIDAAYEYAVASPYPDVGDVTMNVYASDNERSVAR